MNTIDNFYWNVIDDNDKNNSNDHENYVNILI